MPNIIGADTYERVTLDTWGHLFPEGKYFEGTIRVCQPEYGVSLIILNEKIDILSSPWWYDAIQKFVFEQGHTSDIFDDGSIYDIDISVTIVDHESFDDDGELTEVQAEFVIRQLRKTKVLESL